MFDKRGQGLSINTIILIILGIAVLVVLILGFTIGFDKIVPFIGSGNNVDVISTACTSACTQNAKFDFCSMKRELKADGTTLKEVTCNYLAEKQTKYGIDECFSIPSCDVLFADGKGENTDDGSKNTAYGKCGENDASGVFKLGGDTTIQYLEGERLITDTCSSFQTSS